MQYKEINIITMGCSKNLVDSEQLASQLEILNCRCVFDQDLKNGQTVIINTCGFIHDAKQESIDMILQCVEAKNSGIIEHLFVIGCLSELYKEELKKEIPEVDQFFGARSLTEVIKHLFADVESTTEYQIKRKTSTPPHYAYLKIAEGCNRTCAFCSIPHIRGKHRSLPMETILEEAKVLTEGGHKELMLISQDPTFYGRDLYKKTMLIPLVKQLLELPKLEWLRLHYTYPTDLPVEELVPLLNDSAKLCRYLDIPLQHIADHVLKAMHRSQTEKQSRELIEKLRALSPDTAIRTSFIVGHPHETEKNFQTLLDYVESTPFDRIGIFTYSHEPHTYAGKNYKDRIPKKEKEARMLALQDAFQRSQANNPKFRTPQVVKAIVDEVGADAYILRSEYDSPDVDYQIQIGKEKGIDLVQGQILDVQLNKFDGAYFYGEPLR